VKSPATGGGNPAARIGRNNSIQYLLGALTFMAKKTNDLAMTHPEWKRCMIDLLDGIERELDTDTPAEDRSELRSLRSSFERKRVTEARKPYERKAERLVDSRPYLFAAMHRHIGKILPAAVEQAASTMKRARDLLDRAPNQIR